jgi:hypothetical protein
MKSYDPENPEHIKRNREYQARWYSQNKELQFKRTQERLDKIKKLVFSTLENEICCLCELPASNMVDENERKISFSKLVEHGHTFNKIKQELKDFKFYCDKCYKTKYPDRWHVSKRGEQLGMPYGTATQRLRKSIMFWLVQKTGMDICYRCGEIIDNIDEFSIEHKINWLNNDTSLFWDLDNIAFSHMKCNRPYQGNK